MSADEKQNVPCRERYWEELDSVEKIAALREALAGLYRMSGRQADMLAKLTEHQHDAAGQMLVPFASRRDGADDYRRGNVPYSIRTERER